MEKLQTIVIGDNPRPVEFLESMIVEEGVECDVYKFVGDDSRDLGVVTVEAGYNTPHQQVLDGRMTEEHHVSGKAFLEVKRKEGALEQYMFPDNQSPVVVEIGDIMQWSAIEDLVFYEICSPPYEEGRFKNL